MKSFECAFSPSDKQSKLAIIPALITLMGISGCDQPLIETPLENPLFDEATAEYLNTSVYNNQDQVLEAKNLITFPSQDNFITSNPYEPMVSLSIEECEQSANCQYAKSVLKQKNDQFPARADVYNWWTGREINPDYAEVCGITYLDIENTVYQLKTFANIEALEQTDGYFVTHYFACGSCSSLQDLAVYGTKDLTIMAKTCSKRLSLGDKKSCMMDIGFSEPCAETWAFNGQKTGQSCVLECIKEYGLINLLLGNENSPPVNEFGELNRCLMCDEMMSGPGFQYAAGRTRRNSGIVSEIERPDEQVYQVTHDYIEILDN